jgi:hypothetical protein
LAAGSRPEGDLRHLSLCAAASQLRPCALDSASPALSNQKPPSPCPLPRLPCSYHDLSGRPKHLWGVYKKMAAKGYSLGRISDVRGLRIIVDSKADCYRALRVVEVRGRLLACMLSLLARGRSGVVAALGAGCADVCCACRPSPSLRHLAAHSSPH